MSLKSLKNQTLRNKSTVNSVNLTGGASTGPVITSLVVTDSNYNNLDDTAIVPAGGYAKLIGSGFASGCSAYFNGSSVTTTFVSATEVRVVIPATSVGTYNVMLFNPSTAGAIYLNLGISSAPTFTTTAGSLGTSYETKAVSTSIAATGDTPITYALYSGSLPSGVTLASNGTLSGTSPVEASSTTYSFVVQATDAQLQDTTRSFSLTISTDVVTWSTPAADTLYGVPANSPISNVTLAATSAAGYNVTYAANTLPTGVSLSGNTIFGTPTVDQTVYTALTATANTSGRTATRYISWIISLGDPFFKNVSLLLSGDGTNNAQNNTFVDGSTNNFTITRNGNTTQGTFSPYGANWSNYFDGTGDYLSLTGTAFGTGNFTIELWGYFTSFPNAQNAIYSNGTVDAAYNSCALYITSSGAVALYNYLSATNNSTTNVSLNTWTHIAVTRAGNTITYYINGVASGTGTMPSADITNTSVQVMRGYGGITNSPIGYISNLRTVVGTAVYTANFTPSTTPLTAISGTSLLTCADNRFIDDSTNNRTITKNGDVSVQRFSPFSPSAVYSTSVIGGSGYFDGAGDGLTIANNAAFDFGSGNFTIECWFNSSVTSTAAVILAKHGSGINQGPWIVYRNGSNIQFYATSNGSTWNIANALAIGTITNNAWYHVAVTRSGSNFYTFLNGVAGATTTSGLTFFAGTGLVAVGGNIDAAGDYFTGYISDARLIKGTAVYTSAFTPPTAPVTAITNTQLLLNFTNAGIIDNTMLNNLETVGDAKISTTQSKFGGSSMSFDGTGDCLKTPSSLNLGFGTGDFTIECWINTSTKNIVIFDHRTSNDQPGVFFIQSTTGYIGYYDNTLGSLSGTTNVTTGAWFHLAWTRSGTTFRMFVNGTQEYSGTNSGNFGVSRPAVIGASWEIAAFFNGYIDDLRITKGLARYTANFTPSTTTFKTY